MNIIDDLERRGLLDNFSDEERVKKLFDTPQTVYCGFDPSAKSLQLGNFIMINILQRLQKAGHRVIAMLGGATGMIGDPSGKKSERKFLTPDQVMENAECIRNQLAKYIDTSDPEKGLIINNYDWWSKTNVLSYLRDYGKNFQIGYMLAKDIVRSRLEVGISYAEFSYMILQAGDFDHLYQDYHCTMQFGGGDQWGNLTTALDFVKKKEGSDCGAEVFSFKLITDSQGKKFGKSESGALYLDPTMTTPYHIYQYFMNVSDADVLKYLYIFDDRPVEEIDEIYRKHLEHPELRFGQKELSRVIVTKLHGEEVAAECEKMSVALFTDSFTGLSEQGLRDLTEGLVVLPCESEISLLDALINTKLASSKREAREFISNGAVKVNGEKINDLSFVIRKENSLQGGYIFLKRGKKLYAALKF
ncbi:MAG: tyrosine--tRNA ligase [Candidatus Enterosoma sp.]|nr:tyrosine--tRNA ligase [Bacilli bacterium]MDD6845911.1 tyrosine--tRNA ligase [bacterium]MDY2571933.1 tyrosine--tRNA ligase [Candidatus Enterosoma sp.]MCI6524849.1 tyrosine--tRNA ligase [Bacilli bacterium]MCI6608142.1 tyrosine--tRNA ligase [Bacilli bacterium]